MREWFQDSKNQPIIVGVSVVLLIAAVVFGLKVLGVIGGPTPQAAEAPGAAPGGPMASPMSGPPVPGANPMSSGPTTPGSPMSSMRANPMMAHKMGAPGATKQAAVAARMAKIQAAKGKAKPVQVANAAGAPVRMASVATTTGKADPLLPKYNAKSLVPPEIEVTQLIPISQVATAVPLPGIGGTQGGGAEQPTPQIVSNSTPTNMGRVSGLIFSNGVHAIYQGTDGNSIIIQAGDELPDNVGRVEAINATGISVRIPGGQVIDVPVTEGSAAPANPNQGGPAPGM